MGETNISEIKKHVRIYVLVFAGLLALTIITVTISSLHLGIAVAVTAALIIAAMKGSLVASFFMHLISEKKIIYIALLLTAIFLLALLFLPLSNYYDRIGR